MMLRRPRLLALVACAGCGGCIGVDPESVGTDNIAPIAALRAPVIVPVGPSQVLDASASTDPNGDPLLFRLEIFGFASTDRHIAPIEAASPTLHVAFPAPGLYTVQLTVTDTHNATGVALQDVAARLEFPDPPEFCAVAADCAVGDECDAGVCYQNGGTVE